MEFLWPMPRKTAPMFPFLSFGQYESPQFLNNVKNLSQMEFAAELHIDRRSYLDIEHRKNLCCTLALLFFLIYHCKDVQGFVDSCKPIFDKYFFNPDTPCDLLRFPPPERGIFSFTPLTFYLQAYERHLKPTPVGVVTMSR